MLFSTLIYIKNAKMKKKTFTLQSKIPQYEFLCTIKSTEYNFTKKCSFESQCENLKIFLSLEFYVKSNWVILGSQGSSKICTPMVPHTPITKPGFIKYRPEMQNDKLLVILFFCKANNTNLCSQCENFRIFLSVRFYVKSILQNLKVLNQPFFAIFDDLNC